MSELGRIGGIFIEPRPVFEEIAARPRWIVPMVLLMLLSLAYAYAMSAHVGWQQIVRHSIELSDKGQSMPADQKERAVEMGAKFAGISAYVGPLIAVPGILLIQSGLLLLVFNGLFGTSLRFPQVFAIASYSSLPGLISILQMIAVMLLKPPEDFDPQNASAMNVGFYLGSSTPKWLMALAGSIDVFAIWGILLMATGLAIAARKISWTKALLGAALPWVLWTVIRVGWAALRS